MSVHIARHGDIRRVARIIRICQLRSILSDVSPFGPCSRDNHHRDQTNHPIKQHMRRRVLLIAVGHRLSSHPQIYCIYNNFYQTYDITGNYNDDNN